MIHPHAPQRQRGSVYLMVLGASMLVTVIGVSALLSVRVQQRAAATVASAEQADLLAMTAIDQALYQIGHVTDWRNRYSNDVWTSEVSFGGGRYSFKLVDETDGNLADDIDEPVRVYGRATLGGATRIVSVEVSMNALPSASLITNGGGESGATGWSGSGCSVTADSTYKHSGAAGLRVAYRGSSSAVPNQYLDVATLTSGEMYQTEFWFNSLGHNHHQVRAVLEYVSSTDGTRTIPLTPWTSLGATWNHVSGTATISWSGTLSQARLYIEVDAHTHDFVFDDVSMVIPDDSRYACPVPGTWRSEVN